MKISIELDANDEGHKIDACIRGPEMKLILSDALREMENFLNEGHAFLSADAALLHMVNKLKKDADYFNISL
jgi:hypothetical protein